MQLKGPIKAGTWHLIGDGIVLRPADVVFDVIWRHGGVDTPIVQFQRRFEPRTDENKFHATRFEADANGAAVPANPGDLLVLRFSAPGMPDAGDEGVAYIPNGDGARADGRIPSLILPR
jgi:hypothetical protein